MVIDGIDAVKYYLVLGQELTLFGSDTFDSKPYNILILDVIVEEYLCKGYSRSNGVLHVFLDISFLRAVVENMVEVFNQFPNLSPHLGLLSTLDTLLARCLISVHKLTLSLCILLSLCLECLSSLLLGSLVCYLLFSLKHSLECLGRFKVEKLAVIGVDAVSGYSCFSIQFVDLLSVLNASLALHPIKFRKFCSYFSKFLLLRFNESNLLLILCEFVSLDIVLCHTLKSISEE